MSVLVADNIQNADFAEIATPIVSSIIPSIKGAIPGMQGISTLLVNSMANGAANAFLTLRVGQVTKAYCEATSLPLRSNARRSATATALSLVKEIVKEQGTRVVKGAWNAVGELAAVSMDSGYQAVKGAVNKASEITVGTAKSVGDKLDRTFGAVKESTGRIFSKKTS